MKILNFFDKYKHSQWGIQIFAIDKFISKMKKINEYLLVVSDYKA